MKFKILLITFILSLPFWWGINLLEEDLKDFFFWQEINQNPQILTAQINLEQQLIDLKPIRDRSIPDLEIVATSTISVFINNEGEEKVLFEKDKNLKLPFASLAKLMTAFVILEHYDLTKEIKITEEAVAEEEDFGKLKVGKIFSVEYLLYPLLMESSNDAAYALTNDYDGMNDRSFVKLMNWEAQNLEMRDTFFDNATGLDPEESGTEMNYSTIADLTKLTKALLEKPLIWEILTTSKYTLYGPELINTNELLGEIPGIVGGKTGYTGEAGGCMILVLKAPKNKGYLINVILGANGKEDRFWEMERLVNWLNTAYRW